MLAEHAAVANLAVKDVDLARRFYQDVLGLSVLISQGQDLVVFKSGATTFNVYRSAAAGSNRATALTWAVGDKLRDTVRLLKEKGVSFEHDDLPGMTRDGDVYCGGDREAAWFKDPDGNILNLVNR